jgi:hypothetical protein
MKRMINPMQKFDCEACETPTVWHFLNNGLCPACHVRIVSKLNITVARRMTEPLKKRIIH